MATEATLNLSQQIFCLNAASNAVGLTSGTEADLQAAMIKALDTQLPKIPGSWTRSWGPRIFKPKPDEKSAPQNVWYAAVSESQKVVVVAVAGTPARSLAAWINNFNVTQVVNFPKWTTQWQNQKTITSPTTEIPLSYDAYIAKGTADGVYNVLSNPSKITDDGGRRVWEYLQGLDLEYSVVFTGHSMGGAIAPTMALGLKMTGMAGSDQVYAMASAGASPGNAAFNDLFNHSLPITPVPGGSGSGYEVFNTDLFNNNDIVPQAWCVDITQNRNLPRITNDLYTSAILGRIMNWFVSRLVNWAVDRATSSKISYNGIQGTTGFTGSPIPKSITSVGQLTAAIQQQHSPEYWKYIGITGFLGRFNEVFLGEPGVENLEDQLQVTEADVQAMRGAGDIKGSGTSIDQVEIVNV